MEETQKEAQSASRQIPVAEIVTGFNYRRRNAGDGTLVESIRQNGLLAPILVRPIDGGKFQLIAGHRRLAAVRAVQSDAGTISAVVRPMSDIEATAAMVAENTERQDPSAIEDAEGASRMLGLTGGDREEAARRLGWTRSKLDRRLAIMNGTQGVRDAYIEGRLDLGHVEILAALRREVQDKVLPALLAAPERPTVEQLKAMAEQSLLNLEAAIFDKGECAQCQYNTGQQQAMFEAAFAGVRCTNRPCYEGKTNLELERRKAALQEKFAVVRIVRPGENATVLPVRADRLGDQQAKACRTCGNFGACVSAVPDKLGQTFENVCFDAGCNAEKAAAFKKSQAPKKKEAAPGTAPPKEAAAPQPSQEGATTQAATSGEEAEEETREAGDTARPKELRKAVIEYRETIWRAVLDRAIANAPPKVYRAVLAAHIISGGPSNLDGNAANRKAVKALGIERGGSLLPEALDLMLGATEEQLEQVLRGLPSFAASMSIRAVTQTLDAMEVDIADYWKLGPKALEVLTKAEIEAIAEEIGLADACGKHWSAMCKGAKKDLVGKILKVEGFKYEGAIPALMRW
jgi:ParB family chromosome partitioning protein